MVPFRVTLSNNREALGSGLREWQYHGTKSKADSRYPPNGSLSLALARWHWQNKQ